MSLSTYDVTVPVYLNLLRILTLTLDKAAAHAAANKIEPAALINDRLYPDMYPLHRQIASVCHHAVRGPFRLAGVAVPALSGGNTTFDELKAQVVAVIAHLGTLTPDQFAGAEDRTVVFPAGDRERKMLGRDYILSFSMPNFYFHLSMVYAILRHNGVPLGKDDFMTV